MAASRLALFRVSVAFSEFACFVQAVLADPRFASQLRDACRSWFALIRYCWNEVKAWSGVMPGGRYWSAADVFPGWRAFSTSREGAGFAGETFFATKTCLTATAACWTLEAAYDTPPRAARAATMPTLATANATRRE